MNIPEKYIELMLLDIDKEISASQKQDLHNYLHGNAYAMHEYNLLKSTTISIDEVEYTNKEKLYKIANSNKPKLWFNYRNIYRVAAVMLPIIALAFYFINKQQTTNTQQIILAQTTDTQSTINKTIPEETIVQQTPINTIIENETDIINQQQNAANTIVTKNTEHNIYKQPLSIQKAKELVEEEVLVNNNSIEELVEKIQKTENETVVKNNILNNATTSFVNTYNTAENSLPNNAQIIEPENSIQPVVNIIKPIVAQQSFTTYDLGIVDIKINNNDSNARTTYIRKGLKIFKAAKDIAVNGVDIKINL